MKQQYDEIMEHIEVTEEMRSRILQNIRNAPAAPQKKTIRLSKILYMGTAAAACAAVIFAGGRITIAAVAPMGSTGNETSAAAQADSREYAAVDTGNGIVDYESKEALEGAVGFSMPELRTLPFGVEGIRYADYWGSMAQEEYEGKNGEWAILRKGVGEESVSGDYNEYPKEAEITLQSREIVQLKGSEDGYALAEWTENGYSYSVQLSEAQGLDWWQSALEAIEQQEK